MIQLEGPPAPRLGGLAVAEHSAPMVVFLMGIFVVGALLVIGWILPITLGVGLAVRKMYSPHWMWFGIHPVLGWIAVIVFAALPPRRECPACGGLIQVRFRICPYCRNPIAPKEPGQPAQSGRPQSI